MEIEFIFFLFDFMHAPKQKDKSELHEKQKFSHQWGILSSYKRTLKNHKSHGLFDNAVWAIGSRLSEKRGKHST